MLSISFSWPYVLYLSLCFMEEKIPHFEKKKFLWKKLNVNVCTLQEKTLIMTSKKGHEMHYMTIVKGSYDVVS